MDIVSFLLGVIAFPVALVALGIIGCAIESCLKQFKTDWQKQAESYQDLYYKELRKTAECLNLSPPPDYMMSKEEKELAVQDKLLKRWLKLSLGTSEEDVQILERETAEQVKLT